ncbi:phage head closure protein [Paenibacillus sp.]|uniref:phage head closure protein n=1 Tax=Paenibacillus sp. TaxID=58172 RepID=UPI002D6AAE8E|nr:phage head closure protein [Paenibacillus sp.]HZG83835.1 phage head closure protein [Paenibacillus sp.]
MKCADGMLAGRLRHKIVIKSPPTTRNSYGEQPAPDAEWTVFATVWASKEPLLGREYFAAEAAQSRVEVKFRIRYRDGINNTMRIVHGDDEYEILSAIDVQGLKREMLVYVKRVD